MPISRKLGVAFTVLIAVLLFESWFVAREMMELRQVSARSSRMEANADGTAEVAADIAAEESEARGYVAGHDPAFLRLYADAREAGRRQLAQLRASAGGTRLARMDAITREVEAYQAGSLDRMIRLAGAPPTRAQALALSGRAKPASIGAGLTALGAGERRSAEQAGRDEDSDERRIVLALVIGGLAAVVVATLLWRILSRTISAPLHALIGSVELLAAGNTDLEIGQCGRGDELGTMARALVVFRDTAVAKQAADAAFQKSVREKEEASALHAATAAATTADQRKAIDAVAAALGRLAAGDLTVRLAALPPSFEALQLDFNRSIVELEAALRVVVAGSQAIGVGASLIEGAAEDLSTSATDQAAQLNDASRAVDEITVAVRSTRDGASRTDELIVDARAEAEQSREAAQRMVAAMQAIERRSGEIVGLAELIDSIAGETSLIALNARIEATRAGAAGAGFGVVAVEVGSLAKRVAEAAATIKRQIQASNDQIAVGARIVAETGDVFQTIIERVTEFSELMSRIRGATGEQAERVAAINQNVAALVAATQRNAQMAVDAKSATSDLATEADALARAAGRFRFAA